MKIKKEFLKKFGSNITRSESNINDLSKSIFKSFNVERAVHKICSLSFKYTDIVFNRLDRLKIYGFGSNKTWISWKCLLIATKHLLNTLILKNFYFEDNNKCKQLLNIISKLTNLVHLTFDNLGTFSLNDKSFVNNWKQIAVNCSQLKSLRMLMF